MNSHQYQIMLLLSTLMGLPHEVTSFIAPSALSPAFNLHHHTAAPFSKASRLHAMAITANYLDSLNSASLSPNVVESATNTLTTLSDTISTISTVTSTTTSTTSSFFTSSTLFSLDPSLLDSNVLAAGNVFEEVASSISLDLEALKNNKYDFSAYFYEGEAEKAQQSLNDMNIGESFGKVDDVVVMSTASSVEASSDTLEVLKEVEPLKSEMTNVQSTTVDVVPDVEPLTSQSSSAETLLQTVNQDVSGIDVTSSESIPPVTFTVPEQALPDVKEKVVENILQQQQQQQQQQVALSPVEGPSVMTALGDVSTSESADKLASQVDNKVVDEAFNEIVSSTSDLSNSLKSQLSNIQYDSLVDNKATSDISNSLKSQLSNVKYDSFADNKEVVEKSGFSFKSFLPKMNEALPSASDASSIVDKDIVEKSGYSMKSLFTKMNQAVPSASDASSIVDKKEVVEKSGFSFDSLLSGVKKDFATNIKFEEVIKNKKLPSLPENPEKALSSVKDFAKSVQTGEMQTKTVENFRQIVDGKKSEIAETSGKALSSMQESLNTIQSTTSAEMKDAIKAIQSTTSTELKGTVQSIQSSDAFNTVTSSVKQAGDTLLVVQSKTSDVVGKAIESDVVKVGVKVAKDVGSASAQAVSAAAESEVVKGATTAVKTTFNGITIGDVANTVIAAVKFIGVVIVKILDVILDSLGQKNSAQLAEETNVIVKETSHAVAKAVDEYTSFTINGFGEKSFAEVMTDIGSIIIKFAIALGTIISRVIEFALEKSGQPQSSVIIHNIQAQIHSTVDNISHTTILQAIENLVAFVIAVANFIAQFAVTSKTSLDAVVAANSANDLTGAGSNELSSLFGNVGTEVVGSIATVADALTGTM